MDPVFQALARLYEAFYEHPYKTKTQFDAMDEACKVLQTKPQEWQQIRDAKDLVDG